MPFEHYPIKVSSDLDYIQNLINDGIIISNQFLEQGEIPTQTQGTLHSIQRVLTDDNQSNVLADLQALSSHLQKERLKKFNQAETWNTLRQHYPQKKSWLNQLQNDWSTHADVAHLTTSQLFLFHDHLEELHSLALLSFKTLKKHSKSLQPLIAQKYQAYLNQLQFTLFDQKQQIAASMVYRIKSAIRRGSLNEVKLLESLCSQLSQQDISPSCINIEPGNSVEKPQPLPLVSMIQYVKDQGKLDLNHNLDSLFNAYSNHSLHLLPSKSSWQLIPHSLLGYAKQPSLLKRWFLWLFPSTRFRQQFFTEQNQFLINLMLNAHKETATPTTLDFKSPSWLTLENAQRALALQMQLTAPKPRRWYDFLFKKTNAMLENWREFIQEEQRQITIQQCQWLQRYTNSPLPLEHLLNPANPAYDILVYTTLTQLESQLHEQGFSDQELHTMNELKVTLTKRWCAAEPDYYQASIESLVERLIDKGTLEHPIFEVLNNRLQSELLELNNELITRLSNHFVDTLTQLDACVYSNHSLFELTLALYQMSDVLKHCIENQMLPLSELDTIRTLYTSICHRYHTFIQQQSKTWIEEFNAKLYSFETNLFAISKIHPSLDEANAIRTKASIIRAEILAGHKPQDLTKKITEMKARATYLENDLDAINQQFDVALESSEQELEQFKEENPHRLARQQKIYADLAKLGIFVPAMSPTESETAVNPENLP